MQNLDYSRSYIPYVGFNNPAERKQIISICTKLHNSEAWIKASWRRKIKLANKEYSRYQNNLPPIKKWAATLKEREERDISKQSMASMLLFPLRIIQGSVYSNLDLILRYNVSNRLGNVLTRRARKQRKFIVSEHFFYMGKLGLNFSKVPLFHYHQRGKCFDFWENYEQIKKLDI